MISKPPYYESYISSQLWLGVIVIICIFFLLLLWNNCIRAAALPLLSRPLIPQSCSSQKEGLWAYVSQFKQLMDTVMQCNNYQGTFNQQK